MQLGKWYNITYKQTVIEPDKKLKLEGWVNGSRFGELIDAGKMTADISKTEPIVKSGDKAALYYPIKNARQVWTAGAYSGLYIRLTGTVKTQIKNLSIKEL
jgi:hypothetical protein